MRKAATQYNYLEDFINKIRSVGRYAFSLAEVKTEFNLSDKALNQNLYRLKSKKQIAQIRKGFYAIISPEYANQGMIPATFFINDLMQSLSKPYYVGLLSAAALQGAAHQQPMEFFVITEKPALRNIRNSKLKINFFTKKEWNDDDIMKVKTDAGNINVSSPELTALDLMFYINSVGINRAVTILQELVPEMKASDMLKTAKRYQQVAAIQRLGYLLETEIKNEKIAEALFRSLKDKTYFPVLLSNQKNKEGILDDKWKVIKNIKIESDL
jgi:predicted transcriptional regulator of viral defense system